MAFIKRADIKISHVLKDNDHKIEDNETREEINKAAEDMKQKVKQGQLEN